MSKRSANRWSASLSNYRSELIWSFIALLVLLCGLIAALQFSWIGEISMAERERLRGELGEKLDLIASTFDEKVLTDLAQLSPGTAEIQQAGQQGAYAAHFAQWERTKDHLFRRVAVAIPRGNTLDLWAFAPLISAEDSAHLNPVPWPDDWAGLRRGLLGKLQSGDPGEPYDPQHSQLVEVPRFAPSTRGGEQEWLVVELNLDYLRDAVFPDLINTFAGRNEYDAKVRVRVDPTLVIYNSGPQDEHGRAADAEQSIGLLNVQPRPDARVGERGQGGEAPPRGPMAKNGGRWRLSLHHRVGSLEVMVARARWRNLAISGGVLLLIITTALLLVGLSRQREQLAELQMSFVAGVSHELRTPLTVIRTLAFNLTGDLARRPEQVEKYGTLIRRESERLGELVEQVLLFARTRAGGVAGERTASSVKELIDDAVKLNNGGMQSASPIHSTLNSSVKYELIIPADLPLVMVDSVAVKNALRNLIDNAARYGADGENWIGISASTVPLQAGRAVEIRVADRGPGIPPEEQPRIFDAFYRGRRAMADQVHGTGLGLHLTKAAIEAHGGTVHVLSAAGQGTQFIVRLPVE